MTHQNGFLPLPAQSNAGNDDYRYGQQSNQMFAPSVVRRRGGRPVTMYVDGKLVELSADLYPSSDTPMTEAFVPKLRGMALMYFIVGIVAFILGLATVAFEPSYWFLIHTSLVETIVAAFIYFYPRKTWASMRMFQGAIFGFLTVAMGTVILVQIIGGVHPHKPIHFILLLVFAYLIASAAILYYTMHLAMLEMMKNVYRARTAALSELEVYNPIATAPPIAQEHLRV